MAQRRVLIFGGNGFMGRALVSHLRALGDEVVAPSRAEAPIVDAEGVLAATFAARPDVIINLAGISSVQHHDNAALYETNMIGHLRVLEAAAKAAPGARVFLASTANIYGQGAGASFRESDPPAPLNHYGLSKLAAEQLHLVYAKSLQLCAVRPFNCIGRGQKSSLVVSKLVDAFRRRLPVIELGNLDVRRDFVDIRDVCGMWATLISAAPPPVVNFGTGETAALMEVVAMLEQLTGHAPKIVSSPAFARAADIIYQQADPSLITSLGFRRQHHLRDTLAWMLADEGDQS